MALARLWINSRVLKWVFERCAGTGKARKPRRFMPAPDAIDIRAHISEADMNELLDVNTDEWKQEAVSIREHYAKFGPSARGTYERTGRSGKRSG